MKSFNRVKVNLQRKALLAALCISSLTMNACSLLAPQDELSEAAQCNILKELIADHPNKFNTTKKSIVSSAHRNIWSAEKVFPSADLCQIWQWSTGLSSYVCEWKTGSDKDQASKNYQYASRVVQDCLGNEWTSHSATTPSNGERTYFDTPNKDTIVSIRNFENKRSLAASWQTTVIIGDKSNLKAPLN